MRKRRAVLSPARARAQVTSAVTAQRIAEIRRLMATMAWGDDARERLAKQWAVTPHRVTCIAIEASRSLRCDESELEALRNQLAGTLEEVIRHALEDRNSVTGQLDLRAAIDGVLTLSRFRGIAPPEAEQKLKAEGIIVHISAEEARAFEAPHTNGVAHPEASAPALPPREDTH